MRSTIEALIARGFDSQRAEEIAKNGHTLKSLKTASRDDLLEIGLTTAQIETIFKEDRPPIPTNTVVSLLFRNRYQCCICRDASKPFIIHHIVEWSKSRSHEITNLSVLCTEHHDKAHSISTLSQNLTPKHIVELKRKWEEEVKSLDARAISEAMKIQGCEWAFINELRLFELLEDYKVNLSEFNNFKTAKHLGIVDDHGIPNPVSPSKPYKYEGPEIMQRYWYMKEAASKLIELIPIINISDYLDRQTIMPSLIPGDFVFVQGAHSFLGLNANRSGQGQHTRGMRSANKVELSYVFDRWEATSSSSWCDWLVGTKRAGSLVRIKNLSRRDDTIIIDSTVLAITSFTSGLKTRDYEDSWLSWRPKRKGKKRKIIQL